MPGGEKRKILSEDGTGDMEYQESLFSRNVNRPLADRLRPSELDEIVGQEHLLGEGARDVDGARVPQFDVGREGERSVRSGI